MNSVIISGYKAKAMILNSKILLLLVTLIGGCFADNNEDSAPEGSENSASKPLISQRSTGSISPFAPKEKTVDSQIYNPDQDLTLSLWKSRMTLPKGSYPTPLQVSMSMVFGASTAQTQDLQVVSPVVELKIKHLDGKDFDRTLLGKNIKVETIVDRFIEAKSTVALITLAYGTPLESRWLIIPEELNVHDLEDASKMVTFYMRDSDFTFSVATSRGGKPTNGYMAFKSVPRESRSIFADRSSVSVSDEASQVQLTWQAVDGSRTGYFLQYGYEPITTSSCVKGQAIDNKKITKIRQNFPQKFEDSLVISDLIGGSTLYIQLCSTNGRDPPDVSPGVDFIYDVPKRVKAELKGLPASISNKNGIDISVGGKDISHYKFALLKNAQECGSGYSDWIPIAEKINKGVEEGAYLLCVLGKSGEKNQQKVPINFGFLIDVTPPYPFKIDPIVSPSNQMAPSITINGSEIVQGSTQAKYVVATDANCNHVYFAIQSPKPILSLPSLLAGVYYICVSAIDQAGNIKIASNNGIQLIVDDLAPSLIGTPFVSIDSPTGSAASYDDDLSVYLRWDAAQDVGDSGLDSYSIEWFSSADCSGGGTLIEGIASTATYSPVVFPNQGVFTARLRVRDRAGNQRVSDCTSQVHIDTVAPPIVPIQLGTGKDSGLDPDARYDDDTSVFLTWGAAQDNPGGTGIFLYQVFFYSQSNCAGSAVVINGDMSRVLQYDGLSNGSTYSFKVRALDYSGNIGVFSACSGSIMIDTSAPVAPINLREAAQVGGGADAVYDLDGTFYMSWDAGSDGAGSGLESYDLELYSQSLCQGSSQKTSGINPATLWQSNVGSHDVTYSFKIRVYDFAGNSTLSMCSSGIKIDTVPPGAFSLTMAATTKDQSPLITWGLSAGALAYDLLIDDQSTCSSPIQSFPGINGQSVEVAPLEDGSWFMCIKALDAAGNETNAANNASSFVLNSGAWSSVSNSAQAPTARFGHSVVWNSNQSEVVVWGGHSGGSYLNDGGRYDPATDSWQSITTVAAPSSREGHTAVWDSNIERMIVWGGSDAPGSYLDTGGYYQSGGSWVATSLTDQPAPRWEHTMVSTGTQSIVWGGYGCIDPPVCGTQGYLQTGGIFDHVTNTWTVGGTDLLDGDLPAARSNHTAVWTGTAMIVWGGESSGGLLQTGGLFDPVGGGGDMNWRQVTIVGAPSARKSHSAVWDSHSQKMIIWGGYGCTNPPVCSTQGSLADGGMYDPTTDTWTVVSVIQGPAARRDHVAIWDPNDQVMILWGGDDQSSYLGTGAIFKPSEGVGGTWIVPSVRQTNVPSGRSMAGVAWTGSQFFIFGGYDGAAVAGGGRYSIP